MIHLPKFQYLIALFITTLIVAGCELPRDSATADVAPLDDTPHTLAPLGADDTENVADTAAAEEMVVNVQPITPVDEAAPQAGEVPADIPQETTAEDVIVVSVTQNEVTDVAEAAVTEETLAETNTESPTVAEEAPLVVNATTSESPESNQPTAANPPVSETTGDYYAANGGAYTVQAGDTLFGISHQFGVSVESLAMANGLQNDVVYIGQTLVIPQGEAGFTPPANHRMAPSTNTPMNPTMADPRMAPQPRGMPQQGGYHTVVQGETLYSIARQYNSSVEGLIYVNELSHPFVIYAGQTLQIPTEQTQPQYQPYQQQPQYQQEYAQPQYQQPQYQQEYTQPQYQQPPQYQQDYAQPQYQQPQQQPVPQYQQPGYTQQPQYQPEGFSAPSSGMSHTVVAGETLYSIASRYGTTAESLALANGITNPDQLYVGQVLFMPQQ